VYVCVCVCVCVWLTSCVYYVGFLVKAGTWPRSEAELLLHPAMGCIADPTGWLGCSAGRVAGVQTRPVGGPSKALSQTA
jgi:hypothetical protein